MPHQKKRSRAQSVAEASTITSQTAVPVWERLSKWHNWYSFIPVALALLASVNILSNGFVADDTVQVLQNAGVQDLSNIPTAFVTSVWAYARGDIVFSTDNYFRPLFNVFLTICYSVFGNSAFLWHLASILVHAAVVYLVFRVIRAVSGDNWISLIASVLFAVHPAHAESVAWISGITDPLMSLFVLPSFLFYWRYRTAGGRRNLIWCLLFLLAALLTKETAIALPIVIAYCELFHFNIESSFAARTLNLVKIAAAMLFPIAVYLGLRAYALNGLIVETAQKYPAGNAAKTAPTALTKYLALTFLPYGYSFQHFTATVESVASARFLLPVLIILIIAVAVWWSRSKLLRFSTVWFFVWLIPALSAIRFLDSENVVQERYLYLPVLGACAAVGLGLRRLSELNLAGDLKYVVAPALTLIAAVLLGQAYLRQNAVWSSDLSIYTNCVAVDPGSARAHDGLAGSYFARGNKDGARNEAITALDLNPNTDPSVYMTLSYLADRDGKTDRAIYYLKQGIEQVKPSPYTRYRLATLCLNLAFMYQRQDKLDTAEQYMQDSLKLSERPVGWYYLGQLYMSEGRYDKALELFQRTLNSTPPRFAPVHLQLARAYDGLGQTATAKSEYERYLSLNPSASEKKDIQRRLSQM